MATAYTPGLTVTARTVHRVRRQLPIPGDVLVKAGAAVKATDVVAQTFMPGDVVPLNVANLLAVPPADVPECMLKKEGDSVEPGEPIDLETFDPRTQSLIMPLAAGEVLPLDIVIDGDYVASEPGASVALHVKQSCFVRVDDRGLRISPDGRDFDAKPRRKGSFQLGLGVTDKGKRVTLHVIPPARIP